MKRRIVALLLTGGLVVAGLCGCRRSSSGSSLPSETTAEESYVSMETVETVVPDDPEPGETEESGTESAENERCSFDDLVEMWSSGILSEEEIAEMAAADEIDDDIFEEFLAFTNETWENKESGSESTTVDVDADKLLSTYVVEFEDYDGYQIRETIQISPIFTEDDMETVYTLWEALGNDIATFPSKESMCNENRELTNFELEYIVGTYTVENLTEGFSITSDNPRTYAKSLIARGNGRVETLFNNRSVSVVMYSNDTRYYSDIFAVAIGEARMTSDSWGPRSFIIALPNEHTPNQPDGYRYDEIQIVFGYNFYGAYDHSDYDTLQLKYFE